MPVRRTESRRPVVMVLIRPAKRQQQQNLLLLLVVVVVMMVSRDDHRLLRRMPARRFGPLQPRRTGWFISGSRKRSKYAWTYIYICVCERGETVIYHGPNADRSLGRGQIARPKQTKPRRQTCRPGLAQQNARQTRAPTTTTTKTPRKRSSASTKTVVPNYSCDYGRR